jgi:hypothetical protein
MRKRETPREASRAREASDNMWNRLRRAGYILVTGKDVRFKAKAQENKRTFFDAPVMDERLSRQYQQYRWPQSQFTSDMQLRYAQRADWQGVVRPMREFAYYYCRALKKQGIPVYVHTAYRSPAEQLRLQSNGYSTLSSGPHQRGCAVDIVSSIGHWEIPKELWDHLGQIGEQIIVQRGLKIEWGGRWQNFPDPAHWQLREWRGYPVIIEGTELNIPQTSTQMLTYRMPDDV